MKIMYLSLTTVQPEISSSLSKYCYSYEENFSRMRNLKLLLSLSSENDFAHLAI